VKSKHVHFIFTKWPFSNHEYFQISNLSMVYFQINCLSFWCVRYIAFITAVHVKRGTSFSSLRVLALLKVSFQLYQIFLFTLFLNTKGTYLCIFILTHLRYHIKGTPLRPKAWKYELWILYIDKLRHWKICEK
jgi:hypothetical protein